MKAMSREPVRDPFRKVAEPRVFPFRRSGVVLQTCGLPAILAP